ncbi:MAG: hypothetical protein P0S95_07165 [Rhabdochlamydiaceae bacterium]|nr:hypothetical protein [Candidatus Amphrikana amoebophyrae]
MHDIKKEFIELTQNLCKWIEDVKPEIYLDNPLTPITKQKPKATIVSEPTNLEPKQWAKQPAMPALRRRPKSIPQEAPAQKKVPANMVKPSNIDLQPIKIEVDTQENEMLTTFRKANPRVFIHTKVPDDRRAKTVKNGWKIKTRLIDVPLFTSKEMAPYLPFMQNLAKAIDIRLAPSRVIEVDMLEQRNVWETLLDPDHIKLILCPNLVLWSCPHLVTHFKQKENKLGKIDFLMLQEPSAYIKEPLLKKSLWTQLLQKLSQ